MLVLIPLYLYNSLNFYTMKRNIILTTMLLAVMSIYTNIFAQTEAKSVPTGLPGDNFSLHGALELFKNAASLEDFEKAINQQETNVNNLDLNNDGKIDYVRVIASQEKDAHAIVLQAVVSSKESQDIAVIGIEKAGENDAMVQIIGDEDMYGENMLVEPKLEEGTLDADVDYDNQHGPNYFGENRYRRYWVNAWYWPCVQYMYRPTYRMWVSPWHWHYYPSWWNAWSPYHWDYYYPRTYHYYNHFHVVHHYRVHHVYHHVYQPHRVYAPSVHKHYQKDITSYRKKNQIVKADNRYSRNTDTIGKTTRSRNNAVEPGRVETRQQTEAGKSTRTRQDGSDVQAPNRQRPAAERNTGREVEKAKVPQDNSRNRQRTTPTTPRQNTEQAPKSRPQSGQKNDAQRPRSRSGGNQIDLGHVTETRNEGRVERDRTPRSVNTANAPQVNRQEQNRTATQRTQPKQNNVTRQGSQAPASRNAQVSPSGGERKPSGQGATPKAGGSSRNR